ncbi:hypothetical protein ACO0K7_11320 [Undibacterium sp. Ji67W]|uniref:hypothetical protein n=1 Tax=Undibacterium sp. Ji67W TaxID=3413042 RepID=UPI003BF41709
MQHVVGSIFALLVLAGFLVLGGAGHGWIAGAFSCLPLALISFASWVNALSRVPVLMRAYCFLMLGGLILLAVAAATVSEGVDYFFAIWEHQGGLFGEIVVGFVYLNWVFANMLAIARMCGVPAKP